MALGEKDIHGVGLAFADAEIARLGVKIHGLRQHRMDAAKVDGHTKTSSSPEKVKVSPPL